MPLSPFNRPWREQPGSAETGRLMSDLEALARTSGGGELSADEGAGGRQVLDQALKPFPARITEHVSAGKYKFARLDESEPDTFPDLASENPEASGTGGPFAYELNGLATVPVGTKVGLFPLARSGGYAFAGGGAGGSACSDCGWVAGLDPANCLAWEVTAASGKCSCIGAQSGVLAWDAGTQSFLGAPASFAACCGTGRLKFWVDATGRPRLAIAGTVTACAGSDVTDKELTLDCCTDDTVTFAGGGPALCDGTPVGDCPGGNTFKVRIMCGPCCPANPTNVDSTTWAAMPATLTLTLSDKSADCACLPATITLAKEGSAPYYFAWAGCHWDGLSPGAVGDVTAFIRFNAATWEIAIDGGAGTWIDENADGVADALDPTTCAGTAYACADADSVGDLGVPASAPEIKFRGLGAAWYPSGAAQCGDGSNVVDQLCDGTGAGASDFDATITF